MGKQLNQPPELIIPDIESAPLESPQSNTKNKKRKALILFKKFEHVFIESWIAVIAVIILVAGISFFGIWASTRISPISRFWLIVGSAMLISLEALLVLVLSIVVKEDSFRYTTLGGILVSVIRLVFFDLREAEIFVKAIAFIFVAVVMLLMNALYNKFKDRIEDKTTK